ncbi:MAG: hypothetical protein PHH77_01540 [Victivallaceae bacterium]|nr:hypothetical protein [Victivallaceae bacterium]
MNEKIGILSEPAALRRFLCAAPALFSAHTKLQSLLYFDRNLVLYQKKKTVQSINGTTYINERSVIDNGDGGF